MTDAIQESKTEISEEKMETFEEELTAALDHLRAARGEGIPEDQAEEMVNDAITETLGAWGRIQTWLEVAGHE